jgi:hypothetical protein
MRRTGPVSIGSFRHARIIAKIGTMQ